jgi:thioredoxin reductase (NADPH)
MKNYDLIIIGAGGAGLSALMYASRLNLKSLCLGINHGSELPVGGVITTTDVVENYPGFSKISGYDLAKKIEEHAREYELGEIKQEKVIDVEQEKNCFNVKTEKSKYTSKAIIFATGTKWRKLKIPGSLEFEKKGVNYCALCDAPLYKNKIVSIVGGSDSAAKDALVLAQHAKKVYMIYRGEEIHPEPVNLKKIKANKRITIINNTELTEIKGDKFVSEITLNKPYKNSKTLKTEAVFVAIGHIILSDLAKKIKVNTNKKGEIIINHATAQTNVKGVFASGDVTDKPFKQLITGVADACTAAYSAYEYVTKERVEVCD